jgi:ribonuclease R
LVSLNSLMDYDDFRHIESDYMLVGRRSGRTFRMGDKVTIKVVSANLAKRQLDYEWVVGSATAMTETDGIDFSATKEHRGTAPGRGGNSRHGSSGGRASSPKPHKTKKQKKRK